MFWETAGLKCFLARRYHKWTCVRVDNLRQADLSRATSPRMFGGVLLARFDVRVDPLEQRELILLLQDEVRRN